MDRRGADEVIVVQDEGQGSGDEGDLVEQGRQERLGGGRMGRLKRAQHVRPGRRLNRLQSADQISQQAGRVVIVLVQGNPGHATCAPTVDPFTQQRGLAKAGRGRDQRQLAVQGRVQAPRQARTRYEFRARRGNIELGSQERAGHWRSQWVTCTVQQVYPKKAIAPENAAPPTSWGIQHLFQDLAWTARRSPELVRVLCRTPNKLGNPTP
jgi:hypothetical protein